jgi:hypothetical protein
MNVCRCETSFSLLERIKTYIRNTVCQVQWACLALINIEQDYQIDAENRWKMYFLLLIIHIYGHLTASKQSKWKKFTNDANLADAIQFCYWIKLLTIKLYKDTDISGETLQISIEIVSEKQPWVFVKLFEINPFQWNMYTLIRSALNALSDERILELFRDHYGERQNEPI